MTQTQTFQTGSKSIFHDIIKGLGASPPNVLKEFIFITFLWQYVAMQIELICWSS